jgi:hypothetical protein
MVYSNPEDLVFLREKKSFVLHNFRPKRSSKKKKIILDTEDGRFFLKYVGHDIAEDVAQLYAKIMQDNCLKDYFPSLVAHEKGWLIYEYVEGQEFFKFVIRNFFSKSFGEVSELFFLLGKCLASYHKSFIKDFVHAKDYLEPYFLQLNSHHSHDDLTDKIPLVKMYNGFTMRNILLVQSKKFICLDIDGAFHPKLPQYMLPYQDISFSILNILSLSTNPFFPHSKIKKAIHEFLNGYFYDHQCIKYSKYLLQTFIEFHYHGVTSLSISNVYPSMKHILFRKKISVAVSKNRFDFLPSTVNE